MSTGCSEVGALYLHVPFCVRRCRYCDFATSATRRDDPLIPHYMDALASLVRRLADFRLLGQVRTAYVGGGTPTMAGACLPDLVDAVRQACPSLVELTCEANPESLSDAVAEELAQAQATRVSLGVQSLDDHELALLGRVHDAKGALAACDRVRAAGLDLSCDLMCGIPAQTPQSWERSLAGVVDAGACHVSVYPLMVEDGTPLCQACETGELPWPDEDVQASLMVRARDLLRQRGFARYEVASHALPGHECLHNEAYWTGVGYLGLGSQACGMLDAAGYERLGEALPLAPVLAQGCELPLGDARVARYRLRLLDDAAALTDAVGSGLPLRTEVETLDGRQAMAEDLMLGLRMTRGLSGVLLDRARTSLGAKAVDEAIRQACEEGLATIDDLGALVPSEQGWLLGNRLYGLFWGLVSAV